MCLYSGECNGELTDVLLLLVFCFGGIRDGVGGQGWRFVGQFFFFRFKFDFIGSWLRGKIGGWK